MGSVPPRRSSPPSLAPGVLQQKEGNRRTYLGQSNNAASTHNKQGNECANHQLIEAVMKVIPCARKSDRTQYTVHPQNYVCLLKPLAIRVSAEWRLWVQTAVPVVPKDSMMTFSRGSLSIQVCCGPSMQVGHQYREHWIEYILLLLLHVRIQWTPLIQTPELQTCTPL